MLVPRHTTKTPSEKRFPSSADTTGYSGWGPRDIISDAGLHSVDGIGGGYESAFKAWVMIPGNRRDHGLMVPLIPEDKGKGLAE
jgi:hypothetical protein